MSGQKRNSTTICQPPVIKRSRTEATGIHNLTISGLLEKISKLHQSSPLFPEDVWKAYSLHKMAGRLRNLNFEIQKDTPGLKSKLKKVPGISQSILAMIFEYVHTGSISRLDLLQSDPLRMAMKRVMAIWGVGRATVSRWFPQAVLVDFDCFDTNE